MSFQSIYFLYIGIALIFARLFGEIFERIKLSAIIGELLAGFLFGGPIFILVGRGYFSIGSLEFNFEAMQEAIEPFAQIGILMLLFLVGSKIRTEEIRKAGRRNLVISLVDVAITFSLGFLAGYLVLGINPATRNFGLIAFFGLLFVPTSIGTTVRTLDNMKKLNTKEGETLLSLAVFDDFIALFLLLIISGLVFTDTSGSQFKWYVNLIIQFAFILVMLLVVIYLLPKLLEFFENRFNTFSLATTSHFSVGIVFAILLTTAFFADILGVSAAIGAFLLGVGMQRNRLLMSDPLDTFTKIGEGTLIPLFFFSVGSSFVLGDFNLIFLIIIPIAILSKITGSFTGVLISTNPIRELKYYRMKKSKQKMKQTQEESKTEDENGKTAIKSLWGNLQPNFIFSGKISIGMMPKGEITLIISAIALGAFQELFQGINSVIILLVFVTVFLTPLLLGLVFRTPKQKTEKDNE